MRYHEATSTALLYNDDITTLHMHFVGCLTKITAVEHPHIWSTGPKSWLLGVHKSFAYTE